MPYKPKKIKRSWVNERKPYGRRLAENEKFYNSWSWRKVRKAFLQKNPTCIKCEAENKVTTAKYVDHIQRIEDGGAKLSEENLQSLCKFHHDSKSGKEAHGYKEKKGIPGKNT
ncbi:HNH endonuclease [Mesonia aquimarina]|uniref:HNH endonuclease n=1 Tax=Mesonia aquimarina TaxID=1504967 RepID=UPI000EF5B35B|nr:HNH endonuclease signature motif containing protein [Mesonia aquimarina]